MRTNRPVNARRGPPANRAARRQAGPLAPITRRAPGSPPLAHYLLAIAAIFATALLINLPTLHFEFLSWDDSQYVTKNPWIRAWSYENLRHIFTKPYYVSYMPLQLVSYMLDYSIWGLKPFGYHLQAVLLNAVNALLGFVVVRRLFGSLSLAFLAGLLFAVHPSHVESVAWISSRKEVLSTTFMLLSLYFYLRARDATSLRWGPYASSILFFALGALAKVSVVVLPLFLLLVDSLSAGASRRRRGFWLEAIAGKVPFGLVGLGVVVLNWMAQVRSSAAYAHEPLRYLMVKGHAIWKYLGLLTGIPRGNPIYDTPHLALEPFSAAAELTGLIVLPVILWLGYRRRNRVLILGAGWMLVMLLPALLFPVVTYMAERYLYSPSLGFCWLLGAGILALSGRATSRAFRTAIVVSLTAIPLALFATRTVAYNRVWANSESLWSYTIQRSADFRAYNNLARVRMEQNRWEEAERLFKLGARQPNVTSWEGLTAVYYKAGRYVEATQALDTAFRLHAKRGEGNPEELAELTYKRGLILWMQAQPQEALEAWEAALRINPRHASAREALDAARRQVAQGR